ncbi:hypothetical protein VTI74DRAFT_4909 [Chaetomium olivicolor]
MSGPLRERAIGSRHTWCLQDKSARPTPPSSSRRGLDQHPTNSEAHADGYRGKSCVCLASSVLVHRDRLPPLRHSGRPTAAACLPLPACEQPARTNGYSRPDNPVLTASLSDGFLVQNNGVRVRQLAGESLAACASVIVGLAVTGPCVGRTRMLRSSGFHPDLLPLPCSVQHVSEFVSSAGLPTYSSPPAASPLLSQSSRQHLYTRLSLARHVKTINKSPISGAFLLKGIFACCHLHNSTPAHTQAVSCQCMCLRVSVRQKRVVIKRHIPRPRSPCHPLSQTHYPNS